MGGWEGSGEGGLIELFGIEQFSSVIAIKYGGQNRVIMFDYLAVYQPDFEWTAVPFVSLC